MALLRPYSVIMTDFKSNPHVKCSPFNPSEQVGSGKLLRGGAMYPLRIMHLKQPCTNLSIQVEAFQPEGGH